VPQFILDSLILSDRGSKASIIVTQPRRISAISVAARVSSERLEDGSVGYAIRGESKQDRKTKLLFCTIGVVLRRLGSHDGFDDVTHIIVDEVLPFFYPLSASPFLFFLLSSRSMNVPLMETSYCSS
jgi:HrpA-like helicases